MKNSMSNLYNTLHSFLHEHDTYTPWPCQVGHRGWMEVGKRRWSGVAACDDRQSWGGQKGEDRHLSYMSHTADGEGTPGPQQQTLPTPPREEYWHVIIHFTSFRLFDNFTCNMHSVDCVFVIIYLTPAMTYYEFNITRPVPRTFIHESNVLCCQETDMHCVGAIPLSM